MKGYHLIKNKKLIKITDASFKKEFCKFTKDSSLVDGSLNLTMFGKWKAFFNPLVDVVATQGIIKHVLATKKYVTMVDI